jgi:ABC-type glycerol-3-phosphate transport system substrate-binding protein
MYEAPQFGQNGSLVDLTPFASKDSAYQLDDIIPTVRTGLSVDDKLYASPFYAESSFLMYRKDLLKKAGVEMPAQPTWQQVADIARQVDSSDTAGICLRGKPGWGDLGAAFTTVLNTFGGTWWSANDDGSVGEAQVDQPQFRQALEFYTGLIDAAGEEDAANASFNECLAQYRDGKVAMWYDATVAAGLLEADDSPVKGKNGYASAPVVETDASGWLWAWALAIPVSTQKQDLAWKYVAWATGPEYLKEAAEGRGRLGGDPAWHPQVDLRDPRVQEGRGRVRRADARGYGLRADRQPGDDAAPRLARRAVRRDPGVPGRRHPVHPAVLGRDRQADVDRRGPGCVPADRLAGGAVIRLPARPRPLR